MKWFLAAYIASIGADAASTTIAQQRGRIEAVLTPSPAANVVILGATGTIAAVLLNQLGKQHPKAARILTSIGISVHTAATAQNLRR